LKTENFDKIKYAEYSPDKGGIIMLSEEKWNEIKYFKKYGFLQREVARKMEISRNTVRKYLG